MFPSRHFGIVRPARLSQAGLLILEALRLSASASRAFAACPQRYYADYVERVPDDERAATPELSFGIAVHRTLSAFFRRGGHASVPLSDLMNLLRDNWDGRHYANGDDERDHVRRGLDIMRRFYASRFPGDAAEVLAIEKRLSWPSPRHGMLATGRLDLVCRYPSGILDIIDLKTTARAASPEEVAEDFQTAFYRSLGGAAFKTLRPATIRVGFHYLDPGETVYVDYEQEDFLAVWERIEGIARQIGLARDSFTSGTPAAEAFPRRPGRQCLTCPIRLVCMTAGAIPAQDEEYRHGTILA